MVAVVVCMPTKLGPCLAERAVETREGASTVFVLMFYAIATSRVGGGPGAGRSVTSRWDDVSAGSWVGGGRGTGAFGGQLNAIWASFNVATAAALWCCRQSNYVMSKPSAGAKYGAALDEVPRAKPSSSKGRYLKKVVVSTTTGPGIPVDPAVARNFAEAHSPSRRDSCVCPLIGRHCRTNDRQSVKPLIVAERATDV